MPRYQARRTAEGDFGDAGTGETEEGEVTGTGTTTPTTILISPWDGAIDLNTKTGQSLWKEGIMALDTKFSGLSKDLTRFLADVKIRANKCRWTAILTIDGKSLLTQYGEIHKAKVEDARVTREATAITSLATACPKINSLMMYHFLYDSLGTVPQKKLSTKIDDAHEDGPLLLKMILEDTFVGTQASTFSIKERFYDLNLKRYKWNVQLMNQDVREKCADLVAAGHASDNTDIIISLFRAYNTSTNDEFKSSVNYWKNEWNSAVWTRPEELMSRADAKYFELRDLGIWGKKSAKDEQIVALTSQIEELKKGAKKENIESKGEKKSKGKKDGENKVPKWKYDRSLSKTAEYVRNSKTYYWCTGPGHNKKAMWVVHLPNSCDENKKGASSTSDAPTMNRKTLTAMFEGRDLTDDERESKIQAILSVFEN